MPGPWGDVLDEHRPKLLDCTNSTDSRRIDFARRLEFSLVAIVGIGVEFGSHDSRALPFRAGARWERHAVVVGDYSLLALDDGVMDAQWLELAKI